MIEDPINSGGDLKGYDVKLGRESMKIRLIMRKFVWDMDYGGGGKYTFTWKKDDKGNLIIP